MFWVGLIVGGIIGSCVIFAVMACIWIGKEFDNDKK